jgi:hypothetical protein
MIIENYPNYFVTKEGKVINVKTNKILKPSFNTCGYQQVTLHNRIKSKNIVIHRLVANAFIPNFENKPQVNHIDGIKSNNSVSNLEWCTSSENVKHAYKIGLSKISDKNIKATKLAHSKIVLDNNTGIFYDSLTEAAIIFGISKSILCRYLNGYIQNKTSLCYV